MQSIRLAATLFILIAFLMAIYTQPLLPNLLVLQFSFSETDFHSVLYDWPPKNITRFKLHFLLDFPYLICYGALGFLITTRSQFFKTYADSTKKWISLIMPLAAIADAIENIMELYLIYDEKPFSHMSYLLSGIASSIKWILIALFFLISLWQIGRSKNESKSDFLL